MDVDARLWGDSDGEVIARLYRDGVNTASSKLPAPLPVPGGVIEVEASSYGLRRCGFDAPVAVVVLEGARPLEGPAPYPPSAPSTPAVSGVSPG